MSDSTRLRVIERNVGVALACGTGSSWMQGMRNEWQERRGWRCWNIKRNFIWHWQRVNVSLQCNGRGSFTVGCIRLFDRTVELATEYCESWAAVLMRLWGRNAEALDNRNQFMCTLSIFCSSLQFYERLLLQILQLNCILLNWWIIEI